MAIRNFCPKCGEFTYGYNPQTKMYQCYAVKCSFVDTKGEFGEGFSHNPKIRRGADGLEIKCEASSK